MVFFVSCGGSRKLLQPLDGKKGAMGGLAKTLIIAAK